MAKFFHLIRKVAGLYNAEKLLMCGARFVRTHNTAGIDADTRAALRRKNKIFRVDCPIFVLNNDLSITPHSISENAALEGTPFTSFTASPLWGVPQFKRWTAEMRQMSSHGKGVIWE
jgi:hypothetical protein